MLNVFLVSDQPVLLRGLASVLSQSGFQLSESSIPPTFTDGFEGTKKPDVILLDVTEGIAFEQLKTIQVRTGRCPVVLWSGPLPLELVFKTLEYGVRGIIPNGSTPEQLVDGLRRVGSGELQVGFGYSDRPSPGRGAALTPREREIVANLREGMRNKQIAIQMGITEGTVKIYLFRLFQKLGVRSRFELARYGIQESALSSEDDTAPRHSRSHDRDSAAVMLQSRDRS